MPVPGQDAMPGFWSPGLPCFAIPRSSLPLLLGLYRETLPKSRGFRNPSGVGVGWRKPHTECRGNPHLKVCLASSDLGSCISFLPSSHTGLLLVSQKCPRTCCYLCLEGSVPSFHIPSPITRLAPAHLSDQPRGYFLPSVEQPSC